MVLGGWGASEKIMRIDVRRVFSSHIDEKSGTPPKSFFEFLTFVIRHRFFFFVPETLNPIFLGKSKKTRAGKWSRSVKLKVNLVNYDAIWCQIGSQFPWVPMGRFYYPWRTRETFPFFPFLLSMDFPWIFHGCPIEFSIVFPLFLHRIFNGFSIDQFSMICPWITKCFPGGFRYPSWRKKTK